MGKKKTPTPPNPDDERRLFEAEMADVRPVDRSRARLVLTPAKRLSPPTTKPRASDDLPDTEPTDGTIANNGLSRRALRDLKRDALPPDLRLDLHGKRRPEALVALKSFLERARSQDARRVLIIHGRGHGSEASGPVLGRAVAETIRRHDGVVAAIAAPPRLGGTGATLVVLKRRR